MRSLKVSLLEEFRLHGANVPGRFLKGGPILGRRCGGTEKARDDGDAQEKESFHPASFCYRKILLDHSAIYRDDLAGNVGGIVRAKKSNHLGHLFGEAHTTHGDELFDHLFGRPWIISVSISPGATTLTRMPRRATSEARDRQAPSRPALAAE